MSQPPLPSWDQKRNRAFFARSTPLVAEQLLGNYLLRKLESGQWIGGKIVETEAYLHQGDPASHSHRGKTKRNAAMFDPPAVLYVYTIHAKNCMNFSTEADLVGAAVLIRAIEPIWGIDVMRQNRHQSDLRRLARGPAMLCQALQIDLSHNGADLQHVDWLAVVGGEPVARDRIGVTPRIGIRQGADLLLRFGMIGSRYTSRPILQRS